MISWKGLVIQYEAQITHNSENKTDESFKYVTSTEKNMEKSAIQ